MNETLQNAVENTVDNEAMINTLEAIKQDAALKAKMEAAQKAVKEVDTGSSIGEIILVSTVTIAAEVGLYLLGSKVILPKVKGLFKKEEVHDEPDEAVDEPKEEA